MKSMISGLRKLLAVAVTGSMSLAMAQTPSPYPSKPIRLIVPFAAGISPDVVARILADKLSQSMGQPVVVDNRPGASGIIGAEMAAKSPADGYTLLMSVTAIMSMNPHLYSKLSYDPLKDFKPVSHILNVPFVLIAAPKKPFSNTNELVNTAKKAPDSIEYASLGAGSHSHVAMAWLMNQTGAKLTHVPYKGTPATDIMSGLVSVYFDPIVTALPLVTTNKVKALGISTLKRSPALPQVPAISESVPGFDTYAYQGIFAPAGTPDAIVEKLNAELVKAVQLPDVQKKLTDFGYVTVGSSIVDFKKLVKEDYASYGEVIKRNGIRLD